MRRTHAAQSLIITAQLDPSLKTSALKWRDFPDEPHFGPLRPQLPSGFRAFLNFQKPPVMALNPLTALSPLDGRYSRQCDPLRGIFSEYAFMNARVRVEVEWLIALSEAGFAELPHLSDHGKAFLRGLAEHFSLDDCAAVKEIEKTTNHDVKAVEYWIKGQVAHDEELKNAAEFVHFACTSEDINNTSHALMLMKGREALVAFLEKIRGIIANYAHQWAEIPMLSRTHGQTASPTTVGKEFANVAVRLARVIEAIKSVKILAKMNGAVGNYNAHLIAYPDFDWEAFSKKVVEERLGAVFNTHTIQIEPHDYMAELFQEIERANTILIDFDRDVWGYISMHFFRQKLKEGEVGSSTMPHKVNPIDFENSEGNLGLANAVLGHLAGKLDGLADIGGGRERHQTSLGVSRDVESGNEGTDRFLINAVLAARERLELLVGVRHSVTAHDGLHGFGQHFPSSVEVGSNLSFIDLKLAETAFECAVPDK